MENNENAMPINMIIEYATKEYVESINGITQKYNLPMCLVNLIMTNIMNEIKNSNSQELMQTMTEYNKQTEKEIQDEK